MRRLRLLDVFWALLVDPLLNVDRLARRHMHLRKRVNKILFLWDAREFLKGNGIRGNYYEFGVFRGGTFLKALRILDPHIERYYGFDSFRGLPQLERADEHPGWLPGGMNSSTNAGELAEYLTRQVPDLAGHFELVEGFFEESLPRFHLPERREASVLFIDCDLTSSTRTVLSFVRDQGLLQDGTLLYFDDYFAYRGHPARGGQLAFAELRESMPAFRFEDYHVYPPFGKAFIASKIDS